jgi:hypothetical protein
MNVFLALALLGMVIDVNSLSNKDVHRTNYRFIGLSVSGVIRRYFTPGRTLLFLLPENGTNVTRDSAAEIQADEDFKIVDVVLERVNEEIRWSLHVLRSGSVPTEVMYDIEEIYNSYVIFITSERGDDIMSNIITQLEFLKENVLLNSRAQFLFVVISRKTDISSDLAFRILNLSWKYLITDALLMISSSYSDQNGNTDFTSSTKENVSVINFYTLFPYSREQNCSDVKKITFLGKVSLNAKGESVKNFDLIFKRNIKNLYGCPLKVVAYNRPPAVVDTSRDGNANCTGLEITLLLIILGHMNSTAVFSIVPSTNRTTLDIFGAVLERLEAGPADIAVGGLPLWRLLTGSADATIPYFETTVQWIVPCPKPVSRLGALFAVFPSSVWLCISLSFLSVVTVMWLLAGKSDSFNYASLQYCLLNIWAVAVEVSVHKMPQKFRIRGIFLMWIWVSFALCTVFQAFFTTFLVNPGFGKKINTEKELLDSGIPYGYAENYTTIMRNTDSKIGKGKCGNLYACLGNVIKYGNYVTVSDEFHVDYYRTNLSWRDSHLPVCTMEEDVLKINVAMYLKQGHPLLERINKLTRVMMEAGMMVKWRNEFMFTQRIQSLSYYRRDFASEKDDLDSNYVAFALFHLQSALFVLLLGYILSVSTLAVELIYCKFYARHSVYKPRRQKDSRGY